MSHLLVVESRMMDSGVKTAPKLAVPALASYG